MPPYLTQPHFSNSLLIKRLLGRNSEAPEESPVGNESATQAATMASTLSTTTMVSTPVTTRTIFEKVEKPVEEVLGTIANKTHIPFLVVFLIFLVIVGVFLVVFYCCLQRWWRKFRGREGKGFIGGKVDLKSVQLLGQAYKEKVRFICLNNSFLMFDKSFPN